MLSGLAFVAKELVAAEQGGGRRSEDSKKAKHKRDKDKHSKKVGSLSWAQRAQSAQALDLGVPHAREPCNMPDMGVGDPG